jgi:gentisate 1,2-dioxygenase
MRILIVFLILLTSCKSGKEWVYVKSKYFYVQDTVALPQIHHHYQTEEGSLRCAWIEETEIPITLEMEKPIFKKKRVRY